MMRSGRGPRLARRQFLAALALPLAGRAAAATQATIVKDGFPKRVTLLVAGPAGGALDRVARTLSGGLQTHLPAGTELARTPVGGVDGVTGANQFATTNGPDGDTALLVPGIASLAWLAGDSRAHFDPSHWLPILARTSPAIVVSKGTAPVLRPGRPVRVASGGAISPALAAMLAFDLLGADVHAEYGLGDDGAALAALQSGRVDAVLIRGTGKLDALASTMPGLRPQFCLGAPAADGTFQRDITAPDVPTLIEYSAALGRTAPSGPRFEAWSCAAAAAEMQYALVLPSLTPASSVALWREAGTQALAPDLASSIDVVYASAAAALFRSLCPGGAALLDLRSWLSERLGWQPG